MAKKKKEKTFKARWYHRVLVRYWFVIIIIIMIGLFAFEYFFVIQPKIRETQNGKSLDVKTHENILSQQREYLKGLKELEEKADNIEEDELEKLDYVVAQDADLPKILNKIDILIKQSDFDVVKYGVGWENGEITMTFSFTNGGYQMVKKFLGKIESNIRIMDVTNISLKEVGNILSLTIKSYYLE